MFLAADYPLLDVIWTMLVFFAFVIWLTLLFTVFGDIFKRSDISGWAKAGWMLLVVVLPYLGVFIYLITQGARMAERKGEETRARRAEFDDYVRDVASNGGATDQIAEAKELLDSGAINAAEFEQIKQKALA